MNKKQNIMGMIEDRKKFKPTKTQTNPTNPTANVNQETNEFDIDKATIKKQQVKK
ncbi:hypothetical protein ACFQ1Q_08585 [Winogradskyella litorisediminis]|uniref:Glycogen biosynthesis protein GlgD n=1 Tax=Winogradskyella litorisediminis TaxID=1156618 RepID=A0ABW3N6J4_9FLAO